MKEYKVAATDSERRGGWGDYRGIILKLLVGGSNHEEEGVRAECYHSHNLHHRLLVPVLVVVLAGEFASFDIFLSTTRERENVGGPDR